MAGIILGILALIKGKKAWSDVVWWSFALIFAGAVVVILGTAGLKAILRVLAVLGIIGGLLATGYGVLRRQRA